MTNVYVDQFASALGSITQTVECAAQQGQLKSAPSALRGAGFDQHHVCAADESGYTLASRALRSSSIDTEAIDAIIYSTCLPLNGSTAAADRWPASRDVKDLMQFPASRLQSEFGMQRAFVVGLNQQACTGMLGALRLARNFLAAEADINTVLCLTADRFPEGAIYEQAYNLISDGAGACLVSRRRSGLRLIDVRHVSNGAMVAATDDETAGSFFNYTCKLVEDTLQRAGLEMHDVRFVVPQNTNAKAWEILRRLLQVSDEQSWVPAVANVGHVISADNVINLKLLCESGELNAGDRVLTFMAGYGSNWQCALLEAI